MINAQGRKSPQILSGNQERAQSTNFTKEHLDLFFIRLKSIYPTWGSWIKDENQLQVVKGEWFTVLKKLTLKEIWRGFEECKAREDFPPSIAKFFKLALGLKDYDAALANDPYREKASLSKTWEGKHMTALELDKAERANYKRIVEDTITKRISASALGEEALLESDDMALLENSDERNQLCCT